MVSISTKAGKDFGKNQLIERDIVKNIDRQDSEGGSFVLSKVNTARDLKGIQEFYRK